LRKSRQDVARDVILGLLADGDRFDQELAPAALDLETQIYLAR
jgi:hypothetical protein